MPGKIFVNYRRDDARDMAARIGDRLAVGFGNASIFMDVDNLLAGQRFDKELAKALAETDVLLAVIGPRWLELLTERQGSDERDYVREEIAEALRRGITVIPVLIERTPLPRAAELPEDIRDLVLHQKHTVAHEHFGRDLAGLIEAVRFARRAGAGGTGSAIGWTGAAALAVASLLALAFLIFGGVLAYRVAAPGGQGEARPAQAQADQARADAAEKARQEEARWTAEAVKKKADAGAKAKRDADEAERLRLAALKAREEEVGRATEAVKKKAEAVAKTERDADEAEHQRLAALKEGQERKRAEDEKKRAEAELTRPGRVFRDCADVCPELVVVPKGEFTMGSPPGEEGREAAEGPQRRVTIARPFAVGKFEATRGEFSAFVRETGWRVGDKCWTYEGGKWEERSGRSFRNPGFQQDDRHPVVCVNWDDATAYVGWLSKKTGKAYRLLAEAEWEYVARAGTSTPFWWGTSISPSQANYHGHHTYGGGPKGEYRAKTMPVDSFAANPWGLYNVHGNVWEWVQDCWNGSYNGAPTDGSAWAAGDCSHRVLRGGSWGYYPVFLRAANRYNDIAGKRYIYLGFRVGRTLSP